MRLALIAILALSGCPDAPAGGPDAGERRRDGGGFVDASAETDGGTPPTVSCIRVRRLAGSGRYETSARLSQQLFSQSTHAVILRGDVPSVDVAAAATLAVESSAPVLLTHKDFLPAATATELQRLGVASASVLGGTLAVSDETVASISALGISVTRYAGGTRYDTAAMVAAEVGAASNVAVIVSGSESEVHDTALAGGLAAAIGAPVLMVQADAVPAVTDTTLSDLGITATLVVADAEAVQETVLDALPAATRSSLGSPVSTSHALAQLYPDGARSSLVIASAHPDHIVDVGSAAASGRPILYSDGTLPDASRDLIELLDPDEVLILGSEASVPAAVEAAIPGRCE